MSEKKLKLPLRRNQALWQKILLETLLCHILPGSHIFGFRNISDITDQDLQPCNQSHPGRLRPFEE
jgi:hypothetical protein